MNHPTGTITTLFTDIEGSTILWEKNPEDMKKALRVHDTILQEIISSKQGTIIKTTGDGFYAVFASAYNAIQAVLDAQRELIAFPWDENCPIKVRMGLHTGEAEWRAGDYYGSDINRAARVMSLAAGEQVLLSSTTAGLVRDKLPSETTLADLGWHQLKGLTRPEHIYQLLHPALPTDFPPLASQNIVPNNLPEQLSSFIGREAEVAFITDKLTNPEIRQLTLTGPGGVGKTRLCLQVANDCLNHFADGVFFVPLAQVRDATFVPSAIMQALRLPVVGSRPPVEQLKTQLEDSEMLLVLDNFEHVLEASSVVNELLSAVPKLKILVTSRSSLNLYSEQTFSVPPLQLPEPGVQRTYRELMQVAAIRLFFERAQAIRQDFVLHKQNAETVAQICTRLDGLPLAIELAAVRVRILTPQEILSRLEKGIRFLRSGARDLPKRQQTLRATIQWSHDLLSQEGKALFRRMAVFVGGCTLEAAESVCRFSLADAGDLDVLDGLDRLIDHSLIIQSERDDQARFFMLETINEYALEQLLASEEADSVRRYHANYYLRYAQAVDEKLIGLEQKIWLERLDLEHGNLRAALAWSTKADPIAALKIASALRRFWHLRGYHQEGLNWFTQVLNRRDELDIKEGVIMARALSEAGNLAWFSGETAQAFEWQRESVSLWRKLEDQQGLAYALWQLGKATWTTKGNLKAARKLLQESVAILRQIGNKTGLANALFWSGYLAFLEDSLKQARSDLEESINLASEINFTNILAGSISALGRIDFAQGDYASAKKYFEHSLVLYRELGDLPGVSAVQTVFGDLLSVIGAPEQAEACYIESMELDRVIQGEVFLEMYCRLSIVMRRQGNFLEARQQLQQGLRDLLNDQDPQALHNYLIALASLETATGKLDMAAQFLGYGEKLKTMNEVQLEDVFSIERDRVKSELHEQLGEETFIAEWKRGRELTKKQLKDLLRTFDNHSI